LLKRKAYNEFWLECLVDSRGLAVEKLLLHVCCGPCSTYPIERLLAGNCKVRGFFYNPNIHPFSEYEARRQTWREYAKKAGLDFIEGDYDSERFFSLTLNKEEEPYRCRECYSLRLTEAAKLASVSGFGCFTTTLLVSPFQKHDLIIDVGERVAAEYGVRFLYRDFRAGYRESVRISKELGMYRQKYCGCLYSRIARIKKRSTPIYDESFQVTGDG
jgi:predicted adenine nucleotide alpha hydrolase (AANH) superfamily ATPase